MKYLILFYLSISGVFAAPPTPQWPREITLQDKSKVLVFLPQVESLHDNKVIAQAAFKWTQEKKEYYGSFQLKSDALIDKTSGKVTLRNLKVENISLPSEGVKGKEIQANLQKTMNGKEVQIPYKTLLDNLAAQSTESERKVEVNNAPPTFLFVHQPTVLVMISGEPKWTEVKGAGVERVLNTSALFLRDKSGKEYYLWALGNWFVADKVLGPYMPSKKAPSSKFVITKDDLIKNKTVDPIAGKTADGKSIYPPGILPGIVVATKPTELLQSEGEPKYQSVQGTDLLYMSNSPNSIFLDTKTQKYFVLVSGRWFEGGGLQGPWTYVPAKQLPASFAKIPAGSPVSEVLVSIPGTAQSKEAAIASQIPQTAIVPKDLKPKDIQCDGAINWVNITGTALKYAQNCNTPLIEVQPSSYFAVQSGVWFTSEKATGPWIVAIAVPEVIYKIPSSSPIYYVTYVHVFGSDEKTVTVGYFPGYNGTYVTADGMVVYGTGYTYPSYTSPQTWYPAPATYGFGVGYGWDSAAGFYMGFSFGAFMSPWGWGTCCWGSSYVNIDIDNIYTDWGRHTNVSGPGGGFNVNTVGNTKFARAHGSNEVYAGHGGQVYRRDGQGDWKRYDGPGTWSPVQGADQNKIQNLESARTARSSGQDFNPPAARSQPRSHGTSGMPPLRGGGGMPRGGGGFRR
ncbi:hypothetical protein [Bdellovibrio sp. HCB337]|uniref:hypothetical protein n=1 Tax=Bdellovibrio sp. HCB337 TaxID=3394358 RepID=UPI0039A6D35A